MTTFQLSGILYALPLLYDDLKIVIRFQKALRQYKLILSKDYLTHPFIRTGILKPNNRLN